MAWQEIVSDVSFALVIPILAAGGAAIATNWTAARRRMWEFIVKEKIDRIDRFLDTTRGVAEHLQLMSWLHTAHRLEQRSDQFTNLALLLQRLKSKASEAEASAIDFMLTEIVPNYEPQIGNDPEMATRVNHLETGIHNMLTTRLMDAQQAVQDAYARLSIVCYDPEKAATLKSHVVSLADQLIKQYPGADQQPNFDEVFREFREAQRYTIAYLRKDMNKSYGRFGRAIRLNKKWLKKSPSEPPTSAA